MQRNRATTAKILFMAFLGSLLINRAIAAPQPVVEGVDYVVISPTVPASSEPKGKVSVKEFFSFACIHCKDVDPLVEASLVPDKKIDLNKIQVIWGPETTGYAKLNATIQLMHLNKLYTPVFSAVFNHENLNDQKLLKTFLTHNGLSDAKTNKFLATYNSFTVSSKVSEYKSLSAAYNITGTPTFIVADKYMVKPAMPERLIQVVQALVAKASNSSKK